MGIQDRDYYRNEGPSIFDSLMPQGVVCRWLIAINIGVFLLQLAAQRAALQQLPGAAASPDGVVTDWLILDVGKVMQGQVWRLLTFAFLHSPFDYLHLFFNMLFLWWFGSDIEQLYGRAEFLAIYLTSAFLGGVAFVLWNLAVPPQGLLMPPRVDGVPILPAIVSGRCLGASGAVTTMLVLCALHYPRRIIHVFALLPVPIWFFALFSVFRDAIGLFGAGSREVAFIVHLAGAAFAVAYYKWQHSIVEVLRGLLWWKHTRARVRLKLFDPAPQKEEPVAVSATSSSQAVVDEHLEAKLDAVLEKIAKTGKESLTQQEQDILKRAAEMYKRRRT